MNDESMSLSSVDTEAKLLSSILLKSDIIYDVSARLLPSDFYRKQYGVVYSAMLALATERKGVDVVTVTERLKARNDLERIGGLATITYLANLTPTAANYSMYVDIVLKYSKRRQMADLGALITGEANDLSKDISVDELQARIAKLAIGKGSEVSNFSDEIMGFMKRLDEMYQNGEDGIHSGFSMLDAATRGWKPAQLIVLAARPGMGKSALALNFAVNAAKEGKKVAYFSLEMPKFDLISRIVSFEGEIKLGDLQSPKLLGESGYSRLFTVAEKLHKLNVFLFDDNVATPADVAARCKVVQGLYGLDMVIVDYMQLMTAGGKYRDNRVQEVSYISRALKMLAQNMKIPVIALSQLSRGVEARQDKHPMLSDLRESGSIEQDADIVMMLYRESYYIHTKRGDDNKPVPNDDPYTELEVLKNRNGQPCTVGLDFIGQFTKFVDDTGITNEGVPL